MSQRKNPFSALLERLWPKKFTRRHERHSCNLDAELITGVRDVRVVGRLVDISLGGFLFRPRSLYLMDRAGEMATLRIGAIDVHARIVRTIPMGYSLQFDTDLDAGVLASILAVRDARAQASMLASQTEAALAI